MTVLGTRGYKTKGKLDGCWVVVERERAFVCERRRDKVCVCAWKESVRVRAT